MLCFPWMNSAIMPPRALRAFAAANAAMLTPEQENILADLAHTTRENPPGSTVEEMRIRLARRSR